MGKIKRRQLRGSRYNPILKANSVQSSKVEVSECSIPLVQKESNGIEGIKLVINKIQSENREERLIGLNILASFALEESNANFIVSNKIISLVSPLLQDDHAAIRLAAAGALRNLCIGGSDDIVEQMVQDEILVPLAKLLKNYASSTPPDFGKSNVSTDEKMEYYAIFIHATNLLWNLCECNEEAMEFCIEENLSQILLQHINPFVWDFSVSMAAADCLLCVTENSPKIINSILPEADTLVDLTSKALLNNNSPSGLRFAVILTGILVNLNNWTPGGKCFQQIFEVLNQAMDVDCTSLRTQLTETKSTAASIEKVEYLITAQSLALEILSNLCCADDDNSEEDWQDREEIDCEETMDVEVTNQESKFISSEISERINNLQFVEKIMKKMSFATENLSVTEKNEENLKKLLLLENRALQCYQNLVSILKLEDLGGGEILLKTWLQLGKILFNNSNLENESLESISGAMRAILDRLVEEKFGQSVDISEDDLKQLSEAGLKCPYAPVRANMSRMVADFGRILLKENLNEKIQILISISEFLLKVAKEDEELFVIAEALDSIIDLYSDDLTDNLALQFKLLPQLKQIQPEFKSKFNKNKKKIKNGDHRALIITVRDNLTAFIKYKGPRIAKLAATSSSCVAMDAN